MRCRVAALLPCLLAIVACSAFGADTSGDADAGMPDGSQSPDGALIGDSQADSDPDAAPGDGGACPHLRCLTFEEGLSGFDMKVGSLLLVTNGAAPKGMAALGVSGSPAYIVVVAGERAELWVSFYMRVGSVTGIDSRPFKILSTNDTILAAGLVDGTNLSLMVGPDAFVMSSLSAGAVYRVGIHVRQNGSASGLSVEGYFAPGDAPFGSFKVASQQNGILASPAKIQIGSVGTTDLNAAFDDVFVSATAMPAPSP